MDYYKLLSIVSPFVSAFLASLFTYFFTLRTKRFDILYQNKIPAFKEITSKLIDLKKFCIGRVAYFSGNEYSPYYEENVGALHHRTEIANITDLNSVFFSTKSRNTIDNLLNELSGLCNAEASIVSGNEMLRAENEYERISRVIEKCIETLYSELNIL
jgi:hypothetical protein